MGFIISRKHYKELLLLRNRQSIGQVLIQGGVKTTTQTLYDKSLFDNYANADEILKYFLFTRRRLDLEEVNANEIQ